MKLILIITILSTFGLKAQEEYKTHVESIRKLPARKPSSSSLIKDTTFLDYAINQIIKPKEIIYISNRRLLKEIKIKSCNKGNIEMTTSINDTSKIEITIKANKFDPEKNSVENYKEEEYKNYIENINGLRAYGAAYGLPEMEFSSLQILVNNLPIEIPDSAFKNLYDPNFCEFYGFVRNIQAYTSLDGKYIYLYVYGGNAAGTYFTKLIFDHQQFITKWTVEYGPLSIFGCFSDRFIGY